MMTALISDDERHGFGVYYNATKSFFFMLGMLIFASSCVVYAFLVVLNVGLDPFVIIFALFFGSILGIFIILPLKALPQIITHIFNGNRGLLWGGDYNGLDLYSSEKKYQVLYPWEEVKAITLIRNFNLYINGPGKKRKYYKHVVLIHVTNLRPPIMGKPLRWDRSKSFTRLSDGSYLIMQNHPKGYQLQISKLISKYSRGLITPEVLEEYRYDLKFFD